MIPPLSEALAQRGFGTLTPVQQAVIAPELAGRDLLVSAQTGSGKTVGFGLAIAPTLLDEDIAFGPAAAPLGLVVAPTRELALQVMRELTWLYAQTGAVVVSCVGGMDIRTERRALERGAHLVVGTPGRLRDHIERGALDLGAIRALVLDEADEMLDMGFREDLEFMLAEAPATRRTLLFSATVPPTIARLAQQYQHDAQRVTTTAPAEQHADIAYHAVRVAASDVDNAVFNLLRFHEDDSAIVFANTRAAVNHLTARLANRGLSVVTLSGELSQSERTHALQAMRDGRARVCVATDVAARGIDLPRLNIVIHADLPNNTESLLHRSGRTGRAGRKGISALIVPPRSVKRAEQLLRWAKISADWVDAPSVEDILRRDEDRLLADPAWTEPPTEDQAAFAERLLALHPPRAIAAALLRLHQARHAAPEELLPPDTAAPRRERKPFGPSRWVALSVGRAQRAEPRWLLPLLCRAGNLDRTAIGAIRVQEGETHVELAEAAVPGFQQALGPGGTLEEGITARLLDGAPEVPPAPRAARWTRPAPASDTTPPVPAGTEPPPAPPVSTPAPPAPPPEPRKPQPRKPRADSAPKPAPRPEGTGTPHRKGPGAKPRTEARSKPGDGPADRPDGKPAGKHPRKHGPKPAGKPSGKPPGKPPGKPTGKPGRKPHAGADAPAARARGNPADVSARYTPPGKPAAPPRRPGPGKDSAGKSGAGKGGAGKPSTRGAGPRGKGGNEPPRRGKRPD
ncbi:DEAD/DEAH box helicase [Rhodobacteraceae bacterium 2376]|uniref:DEAD/DEAH box helicase n=1 Tax=Rhabdonatronobacter sediminivivens TaxID=2743469 RepID=A0A7Z0I031_9RHOB|nr:DEAD/DEAH box helicase [Rhabdonatronobacter sediminivivens]